MSSDHIYDYMISKLSKKLKAGIFLIRIPSQRESKVDYSCTNFIQ